MVTHSGWRGLLPNVSCVCAWLTHAIKLLNEKWWAGACVGVGFPRAPEVRASLILLVGEGSSSPMGQLTLYEGFPQSECVENYMQFLC